MSEQTFYRWKKPFAGLGEPPLVAPALGPPTDWGEFVQVHEDLAIFLASPDELPVFDIHSF